MTTTVIRAASAADAPRISALVRELSEEFITPRFDEGGKSSLLDSMSPENIASYLASDYEFHVAENDGKLVGVVAMRGESHLYYLFIAKAYQHQGIGRRLWEHIKNVRVQQGVSRFTVNASENAVPAYEQFGFECTGEQFEEGGVVAVRMRLEVG